MTQAYGIQRGLQQVDYGSGKYRSTVKIAGEPVLVSTQILTMNDAIRESNDLALYYKGVVR